jgi:monoamine oxidase
MNSPVTRVTISDENVCVFCGDASQESYDYVILAAPPFSWPVIEFPSVPWNPADYTMQHGPAVKHLNVFDRTFWVDNALAPSALWDSLGSVWEGTDQQGSNPPFALSVFSGGQYAQPEPSYPPGLLELFPGYAPINTRYVDWPSRPYVLTGYSVPAPNQVTTIGRNLASPFCGRVFFAGEQTNLGFFGYMEGALQSGARAARDIVGLVCPDTLTSPA